MQASESSREPPISAIGDRLIPMALGSFKVQDLMVLTWVRV